jgi:DNA-binding transcriptional regulator LsrR (DeoR family)
MFDAKIGRYALVPLRISEDPNIGNTAYRLYALLAADYYDDHPTRARLATDLGFSLRTIDRAILQLRQANAIDHNLRVLFPRLVDRPLAS